MLELWVTWMLICKEYGGVWNRLRRLVETDRYSGTNLTRHIILQVGDVRCS